MFLRWLKFNAVGVLGVGVQLGALSLCSRWLGWGYLVATFCAVESAIVHNFIWHQRWTWKDSPCHGFRELGGRLLRFHVANGLVSLLGNLALMSLLVGGLHLPLLPANGLAIVSCAIINYLLSDRFVFRAGP